MFKALIVLFVTSSISPMGMMTGEFPKKFKDREACETFAVKKRALLAKGTMIASPTGPFKAKVVGSEITCVPDEEGLDA